MWMKRARTAAKIRAAFGSSVAELPRKPGRNASVGLDADPVWWRFPPLHDAIKLPTYG